ncbi:AcrR family transcriptional regulator [Cellulomonas hominis]|uniref:AcrR family transcriptional regulator n=1 Tax=Cellulomonas hominis TaxID=156981 RepID=A0A7W8SJ59_9CELL|nr:TetR/AcrR family transcriptional regulator [Cellulomonas hominis]MBB5475137.1 AcrR family transcriptional regulator [Cellulomonas hominis]
MTAHRPRPTDPRVVRSRAAVLAATLELLAERGVAGATVEAVSARSGVAKTTIYRQWPDQAALVRDAFDGALTAPPHPDTGTLRGDLTELVTGLADAVTSGPAAAIMAGLVDAAERDPAFAEVHRAQAAARHHVVHDVLARAASRGEIPPDTDPAVVLDLLAGPVFHRRWVTRRPLDPAFTAAVVTAALAALEPRTPRDAGRGGPAGPHTT